MNSMKGHWLKAREMCEEKLIRKDHDGVELLNEQLLARVMEFLDEDEK